MNQPFHDVTNPTLSRIRNPLQDDPCPCGTERPYKECGPHLPDENEYSYLVKSYYTKEYLATQGIPYNIVERMRALERKLGLESIL